MREGYNAAYWLGGSKAVIEESNIYCNWKHDSENIKRIKFMNDVFAFWFKARNSNTNFQSEIDEMLNDAGTEGTGSNDFENLLNDYEQYNFLAPKYSDLATYFGGNANTLFCDTQITVPFAFKYVAEAIDEKLEPLKGHFDNFYKDTERLNTLFQQNDWNEIKIVLENIEKYSSRAQKFLWIHPASYKINNRLINYTEGLSTIHSCLSQCVNIAYGASDIQMKALQTAIGFVPVLGNYYGAMANMIPILKDWFVGIIDKRCRVLDAAARAKLPDT